MRPANSASLDLPDEQAFAASFRERAVLDGIAGRADGDDLDGVGCRQGRDSGGERIAHEAGLHEGELAAARAEAEERSSHDAALEHIPFGEQPRDVPVDN